MSTFLLGLRYFFLDLIGGVLRWPFWWYTSGLGLVIRWAIQSLQGYARMLAIGVWTKNIFVPMFGMHDWQSRIISFFMRVVQIIGRSIALFLLTLIILFALALYVLVLPAAVGFAAFHFTGALVT